jgi:hypothetical protein
MSGSSCCHLDYHMRLPLHSDVGAIGGVLQGGAAVEALRLYAQAALLDASDIVLWNRMGALVSTCFAFSLPMYLCNDRN